MVTKNVLMTILQNILNAIDEGIHVIDKNGFTILYNHAMAELEGMEADEVVGQKFLTVFPDLNQETSTLLQVLRTEKPILDQSQTYLNRQKKQIMTINSTIPLYVDNEKIGAVEIAKNITRIKDLSDEIMRLQQTITKPAYRGKSTIPSYTFEDLKGQSPGFQRAIKMAKRAAKTSSSVMIYGETGTGKELFVQGIHHASRRSSNPFIAQNCAAFPESLLESILFGTAKGSFTGAVDRPGIFEQASGGTILLDEINSMGLQLQAKLLRVLQEGYVRRVGGLKDIPVDVRMIATTNEEPQHILESGKIRRDLYYRLNVVNLIIPPLRERMEDISLLTDYFVAKFNDRLDLKVAGVTADCLAAFRLYPWPGNVRELENAIEGAMNLSSGEDWLDEDCFPDYLFKEAGRKTAEAQNNLQVTLDEFVDLDEVMEKVETTYIKKAMLSSNGNISQAAKRLGIKRQTLQHKLKKFSLDH
ncbi:MAG: sigma 54-interacting transcriptional regulator [Bacillota bacterium]|nr:sigma 54-interacting transcriptional regulator [Bacillota bacterium]